MPSPDGRFRKPDWLGYAELLLVDSKYLFHRMVPVRELGEQVVAYFTGFAQAERSNPQWNSGNVH